MNKGHGLRIGFRLNQVGSFSPENPGTVMGDELVAQLLAKELRTRDEVEEVRLIGGEKVTIDAPLDVLIYFNVFVNTTIPKALVGFPSLLYLQNVFPEHMFPGGTLAVFEQVRSYFDGYIFTSAPLRDAMKAEGLVLPFATDPTFFAPQPPEPRLAHPVAFCGNNLRGWEINRRYLAPAMRHGLAIYGGLWTRRPYDRYALGKLPMEDLPLLYASAKVNLNLHLAEHVRYETLNLRVYDCLACGGFMMSDRHAELEREFSDAVAITEGDEDMAEDLSRYLRDEPLRRRMAETGRRIVLEKHTYKQRADTLLAHLKEIL